MTFAFPDTFEQSGYNFARLDPDGLETMKAWLLSRHLHDWWTPDLDEMDVLSREAQGSSPTGARFIVSHGGRPFAYIQCVEPRADLLPEGFEPAPGAAMIQQFVGDADMIGFGHGTNFIKAFVSFCDARGEIAQLLAAPLADSQPAIRSYAQAGFRPKSRGETKDGLVQLMVRNRA